MRFSIPQFLLVTFASVSLVGCFELPGTLIDPSIDFYEGELEDPNFVPSWTHKYTANSSLGQVHGDVHQLSDGTYSVLHMPGGDEMEVLRFSNAGVPLASQSFKVPQTYAGCPFMPNEETFIDDSAILSYSGFVFRVDLKEGKVMWTANFEGALQHSSRGFWVMQGAYTNVGSIRPLDIELGLLEPGLQLPSTTAPNITLVGASILYDDNEGSDNSFQKSSTNQAGRRYLVVYNESSYTTQQSNLLVKAYSDHGQGRLETDWTLTQPGNGTTYQMPGHTLVDGQLYMALEGKLLSLDMASGEQNWSHDLGTTSMQSSTDKKIHVSQDQSEIRFWDAAGTYRRVEAAGGNGLTASVSTGATGKASTEPVGDDYFLTTDHAGKVSLHAAATGREIRTFRGVTSNYHAPVGTHYDAASDRLLLAGARGIYAIDKPATNISE